MKASTLIAPSVQVPVAYFGVHVTGYAVTGLAVFLFLGLSIKFVGIPFITIFGAGGVFLILFSFFKGLGHKDHHWESLLLTKRKLTKGKTIRFLRAGNAPNNAFPVPSKNQTSVHVS